MVSSKSLSIWGLRIPFSIVFTTLPFEHKPQIFPHLDSKASMIGPGKDESGSGTAGR